VPAVVEVTVQAERTGRREKEGSPAGLPQATNRP